MQCQILYNSILPADSEVQDLPQNLPGGHLAAFLFFLNFPEFPPPQNSSTPTTFCQLYQQCLTKNKLPARESVRVSIGSAFNVFLPCFISHSGWIFLSFFSPELHLNHNASTITMLQPQSSRINFDLARVTCRWAPIHSDYIPATSVTFPPFPLPLPAPKSQFHHLKKLQHV